MAQLKTLPERSFKLFEGAASKAKGTMPENAWWASALGLSGLAIGLTLGFLFAPRSGEETRDLIAGSVGKAGEGIRQAASNAGHEISNAGMRTRESVQSFASRMNFSA